MESKSRSDAFGAFLQGLQSNKVQATQTHPRNIPMRVLTELLDSGPEPVAELMSSSGLPFTDFADVLLELQKAEFITLHGLSGKEVVQLTPAGERLARFTVSG